MVTGLLDYSKNRIAGIESGGRYDALGPVTDSGDRAYGKYQVMGSNVGPWTRQYFDRELTPEEFAKTPEAQEAVFEGQFGSYVDKYGPAGAARAWFAGEGGMNDPNRQDILGTSVADYERKFLGGQGFSQPMLLGPTNTGGEAMATNGLLGDALNNPLLQMGMGLLSASGPSLTPVSTGQALAQGYDQAQRGQQLAQQNQLNRMKLEQASRQQRAAQELRSQFADNPTMGLLAEVAPEQVAKGLLASMVPQKPSSFERKATAAQQMLGRPLNEDEILKMAGGGTTINMGDTLDTPIPITQIPSVRLPNGEPVPLGTTFGQAQQAGARVMSADEQKKIGQGSVARGVVDQAEDMLFGSDENPGILSGSKSGAANRAQKSLEIGANLVSQNDPRVPAYSDFVGGTIGNLVRTMGESGALAEGDVQRASGLMPRIFPYPDTEDVARNKLKALRELLNRGFRNAAEKGIDLGVDPREVLGEADSGGPNLSPITRPRSRSSNTSDPLGIR